MSGERTERAKYQLRNLPPQDYRRQLEGPPISREAIHAAATRETNQEEGAGEGMDQLLQLLAEQLRQQQEDRRQQQEERRQEKEERRQREQQEEEYRRKQQEEQRRREQQEEEYRRQQQEEQRRREQREEEHRQLIQVQMMEALKVRQPTVEPYLHLAPFEENEDIQDFLEAFEGVMNIQKIDQKEWVLRLTPLLKGKARAVCIDVGAMLNYVEVKKVILSHYSVSPERCRKGFRAHTWTRDAEPNAWVAKGKKLMNRWLLPEDGMEQVLDKIAVEQFINALPQELRIWVASHSPETPTTVAKLIEAYDSAHSPVGHKGKIRPQDYKPQWKSDSRDGKQGKWKEGSPRSGPGEPIVCYKCNKKGHMARNCTTKTLHVQEKEEKNVPCRFVDGEVNGQPVTRIQLDSGASRTIVNRSLISPTDIGEKSIVVTFGNGTCGEYPLATINVKIDDEEYCLEAAVVQDLVEEVLLGRDVPLCKHLVKRLPQEEQMELLQQLAKDNKIQLEDRRKEDDRALAVVTRAQKRARTHEDAVESQEGTQEDVVKSQEKTQEHAVESHEETQAQEEGRDNASRIQGGIIGMQDGGSGEKEFPFDDELFEEQGKTKPRLTRAERRKHNQQWIKTSNGLTSTQLKKEQEEDPGVQKWMAQEDPTRIKRVNGVLCRIWRPRDSQETVYEQVVLPKRYHQRVIRLAHDVPFAGHLGREKTARRILRQFYWLTLFHHVRHYCQTCEECHRHRGRRVKAPWKPLPVIGEPFRRIAMDIVGPLPVSYTHLTLPTKRIV